MTPATFPRVANFNSVDLRTVGKAYLLNSFFTFVKRNSPAPFHPSLQGQQHSHHFQLEMVG